MEDQQPDPGDLTTDAATQAQQPDTAAKPRPRNKHRMPPRRQLETTPGDGETTGDSETTDAEIPVAVETPEAVEVTSNATEVADVPVQPAPRRRRFSLRRKPKAAEPEQVSESLEQTPEEAAPVTRTPVGKSRRNAKPEEPTAVVAEEQAEENAEVPDVEASPEAEAVPEAEAAPEVEQILVPHRPASKRLMMIAVAASVLFVAAAGFAAATVQPYLSDRAAVDTKLDVARTAASAITTLWTYTPDNLESLPDRSERFLGGDFAYQYRKYIDAIIAPNKQAQVTNTTQVMGAAVESLTPSEATAIVYTNSVATSPVTKNIPSLRYLSYRLTLEHRDTKWLITKMSTVTSLDLTPQL